MKRIDFVLVLTAIGSLSTACADRSLQPSAPSQQVQVVATRWEDQPYVFGRPSVPITGTPTAGTAKVVLLRPLAAGATGPITNIYINGRYLSSLMVGAYVVGQPCAGPTRIAALFDDASLRYEGRFYADRNFDLQAGNTYYFLVTQRNSAGPAQVVSVNASRVDFSQYKAQAHALSRVTSSCANTPAAAGNTQASTAVPATRRSP